MLGEMARVLRDHWAALLPAAIVIFVPVGLLETLDAELQDTLADSGGALSALELISVTLLHTASALLSADGLLKPGMPADCTIHWTPTAPSEGGHGS